MESKEKAEKISKTEITYVRNFSLRSIFFSVNFWLSSIPFFS